MSNDHTAPSVNIPNLAQNDNIYRLLINKGWIDWVRRKVIGVAFIRQRSRSRDADGLSVSIAQNYPLERCRIGSGFKNVFGVGILTVGYIRSLDVQIVPDATDHANIDLPFEEDDLLKSHDLAELLAEQSVYIAFYSNPKTPIPEEELDYQDYN